MAATRPRYCGVLLVAALWLTTGVVCAGGRLLAQTRKRTPPPPPFASLFPLEEAWSITLPALPVAPAARDGARLFVPLVSKTVVALDWRTGDTVWSIPLAATSAPLAANGTLYVGVSDTLHARDAATGAERWTAHARGTLQQLAVAGNRLVAMGAGIAHAFDLATGTLIWSTTLPPSGDVTGIATAADAAYASYAEGRVVALSMADGRELWSREVKGRPSPPLVHDDSVYVGATDNRFYALDAKDGKERWSWRTGGDVIGAAASVTPKVKAVYYASLDAVVRAVNPGNGHQRWKRDGGTRAVAPPIALDGSLVVAGLSPSLSAFAPLTGVPQGTFDLPGGGEVHGTPLVADRLVPRAVAMAVVLKDGRAFGLRSLTLMFNENPPSLLLTLPGSPLTRERLP